MLLTSGTAYGMNYLLDLNVESVGQEVSGIVVEPTIFCDLYS
jgi:hypothetical protein